MLRFLIALSIPLCFLHAEEAEIGGTLFVSYQTGPKAERLDRVRFWLKDEHQNCQMFPKGDAFVSDHTSLCRLVVVEDLEPGKYTLTFVIPNGDHLFESIPPKEIEITSDSLVKVDQMIKPRYASLRAQSIPHSALMLYDSQGILRAQATKGFLAASCLSPGTYTLVFADLPGYRTPPKQVITLVPDENVGPITGTYEQVVSRQ